MLGETGTNPLLGLPGRQSFCKEKWEQMGRGSREAEVHSDGEDKLG